MVKKPTYTQTLTSLETHIVYIREHLGAIDEHLGKLNDSVADHETRITHNSTHINLSLKICGGLLTVAAIVLPILWVTGVFS